LEPESETMINDKQSTKHEQPAPFSELPDDNLAPQSCEEKWAIMRGIPESMNGNCLQETNAAINLQRARSQHEDYIEVLRSAISNVVIIEADERYPDCVFVEDPILIIDNTAIINNLGHPSRRGEHEGFLETLESLELEIINMPENGDACLDGGDVLQCGCDIFVGISKRTNQEGLAFLQKEFPKKNVIGVPVPSGLHLKSFVSCASPDYLITSIDQDAQQVANEIAQHHAFVRTICLPDVAAANLLFVVGDNEQGLVIARSDYPDSFAILQEQLPFEVRGVDMSEDEKADGAITCHSLLWRSY